VPSALIASVELPSRPVSRPEPGIDEDAAPLVTALDPELHERLVRVVLDRDRGDTGVFPGGDRYRAGATLTPMTMYLPNDYVLPTGYEPGEFLELPTIAPWVEPKPRTPDADIDDAETTSA
jgi:hypothetical protein